MTALLRVENLCVTLNRQHGKGMIEAVSDVSFSINPAETFALVGQSGSGKTTLARAIIGLCPVTSGSIYYCEQRIGIGRIFRKIQMVFQNPYRSLNPYWSLEEILTEPLEILGLPKPERLLRIHGLLDAVHLSSRALDKRPQRFSGGERQRIAIARALAMEPELLICDEALSALDVTVQAQIIALFLELQKRLQLAYLFIAHDLAVVERLSHQVAVMKSGQIVEQGPSACVYAQAQHPYTRALLNASYRL